MPGRVHVRNVRFTFQDHNVQFSIDMASAFMVLHLTRARAAHLPRLALARRGRGRSACATASIPWSKHEPCVGAFPPIPEYPSPAVFEARVPEAPISDAEYNLWTVHFDDVDAGVSEVWVQAFRYRGKAGRARAISAQAGASAVGRPGLARARAWAAVGGRVSRCTRFARAHRLHRASASTCARCTGFEPLRYISAHVRLDSPALDPQVYALFAGEPAPRVSSASGSLARGRGNPARRAHAAESRGHRAARLRAARCAG